MSNPVKCFCGREPKVNTHTKDKMVFSFSCCCGENSVSVFVRSDSQDQALKLWQHLVSNRLGRAKAAENAEQTTPKTEEELPFIPMVSGTRFGSRLFWGA
jgi:hypothetical protein